MNKKYFLFFIIIFCLFIGNCSGSTDYFQSYTIIINKKEAGTVNINEKIDRHGNRSCISEIKMDNSLFKRNINTEILFKKENLFPVYYSCESDAGISYTLKVKNGQIIRSYSNNGKSEESITPLVPGMVILDPTVFHTIDYWIQKYDRNKGGYQLIQTYLLPEGSIEQVSIVPIESYIPAKFTEYEIRIKKEILITLLVDENNRLYRMFFNIPNIKIFRSDLYEKLKSKKENPEKEKA